MSRAATARNSRAGGKSRAAPRPRIADLLSAFDQQAEPPAPSLRRRIELPKYPPAVGLRETPEMALDWAANMPGYLNTVPGAVQFGLYFPGYPWLAEFAQRSEYRQPVETTANELTRKWIVLKSKGTSDKTQRIQELTDDLERFKVRQHFRQAAIHDGFFGLALMFIDIKGQEDHALPLKVTPQGIPKDSLRGFKLVEPMWTAPIVWNSLDPTADYFYKPERWMILGRNTHAERLMTFISRPVPDIIKPAYNMGGISLTQLIQPYVDRWLRTVGGVNRLIENFSIIFLQTDLAQNLANAAQLKNRLALFQRTRDNQGVFVTDKERENLQQLAVPLSGLSELQAQAQEHMAAPTHLPLPVLTGITPAGLNATAEGDIEIFHDWIHSMQEAFYRENLDKTLAILMLNRWGEIDEEIVADFVQLKELDGEAAARVRQMAANAGIAYIQENVITPAEERQRLAADPESGYINLDPNAVPEPPELGEGGEPGEGRSDDLGASMGEGSSGGGDDDGAQDAALLPDRCAVCGKRNRTPEQRTQVWDVTRQEWVNAGPECERKVLAAGAAGYTAGGHTFTYEKR